MKTLTITIETGNDAMRTEGQVGRALQTLGHKFVTGKAGLAEGDSGKIMDDNGNSVGTWEVTR